MLKLSFNIRGAAPNTAELLGGRIYLESRRRWRDSKAVHRCNLKRGHTGDNKTHAERLLPLKAGSSRSVGWAAGGREPRLGLRTLSWNQDSCFGCVIWAKFDYSEHLYPFLKMGMETTTLS